MIAVAAAVHRAEQERASQISGRLPGHERKVEDDWVAVLKGEYHPVSARPVEGGFEVTIDDRNLLLRTDWKLGESLFKGEADGTGVCMRIEPLSPSYRLYHSGYQADVLILNPRNAELHALMPVKEEPDTSKFLLSPMPGLLASISVEVGQHVKIGTELAVVEAMKMENVLRSERDGVISSVHAKAGDGLAVDQVILEFE